MKSLREIFEEREPVIRERLQVAASPQQAAQAILEEFDVIIDPHGAYLPSLTDLQYQIAVPLLDAIRIPFKIVASIRTKTREVATLEISGRHTMEIVGSALEAAAISTMLRGFVGLIAGMVGGITVGLGLSSMKSRQRKRHLLVAFPEENPLQAVWDTDSVIAYLRELFGVVDEIVAAFGQLSEKPSPAIEDHPEVLELFQDLLGDMLAPEAQEQASTVFRVRANQIKALLHKYGIRVVDRWEPSELGEKAKEWFNFEPSLNPAIQKMIVPALVKDGNVLLRGRVVEPSSD